MIKNGKGFNVIKINLYPAGTNILHLESQFFRVDQADRADNSVERS